MRRCPECGSLWDDTDSFCRRCGRTLSDSDWVDPNQASPQEQGRGGSLITLLILALCVMLVVPMVTGFLNPVSPTPQHTDLDKSYSWTVPGITDPSTQAHTFSISLTIDEADLNAANSSTLPREGSAFEQSSSTTHAVSEYVVVGRTVTKLCDALWKEYSDFLSSSTQNMQRYGNAESFANYLLSFVSSAIEYEDDVVTHGQGEYWCLPVESLYIGKGDCEDSSILLAAVYDCMSTLTYQDDRVFAPADYITGACIILMPSHAMAGVSLSSTVSDTSVFSVMKGGATYYFCETTAPGWSIGGLHSDLYGANAQPFLGYVSTYV